MEHLWSRAAAAGSGDDTDGGDDAGDGRDGGWTTVRALHEALAADRDLAYTTVMTVVGRLHAKGLLDQEREGRAYRYRARETRGAMTAGLMRQTLDDLAEHDREPAIVAFVEEASADDLEALRRALERLER